MQGCAVVCECGSSNNLFASNDRGARLGHEPAYELTYIALTVHFGMYT